ncbi:MAG: Gfo/Idh/MocA family oxidoreductase [Verrucomicrobia bacterium]|nr:Gfo/Idh/MocA family oxidoreductase [Verrucomicrobiota bacterium]MDE3098276.1 Gfo/Idh/MocA family oxidoreductase [Verrucomicrobiota bacterium]
MNKLRIGFLSTAAIGRKNWKAVLNSGNSVVTAVASREVDRSRDFISTCQREAPFEQVPAAYGSYDELLASPRVDAVYIPLPTGLRREIVVRAAGAGKHVLCEKPCAADVAGLEEMIGACRKNGVQFMDGVMFMHNERLQRIRQALAGNALGGIKRIASQFSFCGSADFLASNIRVNNALEPLGCLGDLGWYCVRFILWALDWEMPSRVDAEMIASAGRAPTEFSAELFFKGGVSAAFYCSFLTASQQWVSISCHGGCLYVPDFVLPFAGTESSFEIRDERLVIAGCDFEMQPGVKRIIAGGHSHSHPTAQESNMFRNFARQIFTGRVNEDWPEWSLKTQRVVNGCYEVALGAEARAFSP